MLALLSSTMRLFPCLFASFCVFLRLLRLLMPPAEISGRFPETAPANKPFSPRFSMVGLCSRPFHAARGNLRPVSGNCTREQAFFTLILHGRALFPSLSHRPRKFTVGFRKLHPRTSLFHPDSPWSGSVPAPFTPPAEISSRFPETAPANKPFSPQTK